jgi:hypothetical protein
MKYEPMDIAKRLRARADEQERNNSYEFDREMDREAADEIERLQKGWQTAFNAAIAHQEEVERLRAENERLKALTGRKN